MSHQNLSLDEQHLLQHQIIPAAESWVLTYPPGSSLFNHGRQTLEHWGAATDPMVSRKLAAADAADLQRAQQVNERAER